MARLEERPSEAIERIARRLTGAALADRKLVPAMIDRIRALIAPEPS